LVRGLKAALGGAIAPARPDGRRASPPADWLCPQLVTPRIGGNIIPFADLPLTEVVAVPHQHRRARVAATACLAVAVAVLAACPPPTPPPAPDPVAEGERLFFNERFDGNGRTCGTCHRMEDNFGLTPAFIATLPADDPLFVAESNPDLTTLENPRLMREFGMILENLDGFADLANRFTMRGIPHTLSLGTSVNSAAGPRTGWSGDGAPGDGSLRSFATGAVIQHFPRTLNRIPDVDFRLPTDEELDAMEAFMLSLGRQEDLVLPLNLKSVVAARGQEIFRDNALGKCNACHFNAGASSDPAIFGAGAGNQNFDTGVEALPDQPADLTGELVPPDDGLGVPGDGTFNTPPLVEAADTGPFFHNNTVETIEGAVAFYNGDAFNDSPAGQLIAGATGSGINLDGTQVVAVAAFLRVINALENIRETIELLERSKQATSERAPVLLARAIEETGDAIMVLRGGGLHPASAGHLETSRDLIERARGQYAGNVVDDAIEAQERARDELVESN
jgi:cytochrome c peroxidase